MIEMEYADGGTLAQLIIKRAKEQRKMREIDILYLFHQMTSAIGYMHKHNVLHRYKNIIVSWNCFVLALILSFFDQFLGDRSVNQAFFIIFFKEIGKKYGCKTFLSCF